MNLFSFIYFIIIIILQLPLMILCTTIIEIRGICFGRIIILPRQALDLHNWLLVYVPLRHFSSFLLIVHGIRLMLPQALKKLILVVVVMSDCTSIHDVTCSWCSSCLALSWKNPFYRQQRKTPNIWNLPPLYVTVNLLTGKSQIQLHIYRAFIRHLRSEIGEFSSYYAEFSS